MRVARDQGTAPVSVSPTRRVSILSGKAMLQVLSMRTDWSFQPWVSCVRCISQVVLSTLAPRNARNSPKALRLALPPLPWVP
ncbi:hypothetical protein D3C72_1442340 [compost metagenome]